jgi:hypothetical protein
MLLFNRETNADDRRLFNRATRAIKRYVIPLARDKNLLIRLMGIHRVLKLTMPQVIMFNRRHAQTVLFPWPTWPGKTCMSCGQTGFKKVPLSSNGKY